MTLFNPAGDFTTAARRIDEAVDIVSGATLNSCSGSLQSGMPGSRAIGQMSAFATDYDDGRLRYTSGLSSLSQSVVDHDNQVNDRDASGAAAMDSVETNSGYNYPSGGGI